MQRFVISSRGRTAALVAAVAVATVLLAGCIEASSTPVPEVTVSPASTREPATHTVERGETLLRIARARGVPVETLVELNGIENPDLIEPGAVLLLEAASTETPARPRAAEQEASDPVATWIGDRWDELRSRLTLSERSVEQGAVAALLLPALVIAGLALWFVLASAFDTVLAISRPLRRRASGEPVTATLVAEEAAAPEPSRTHGLSRLMLAVPRGGARGRAVRDHLVDRGTGVVASSVRQARQLAASLALRTASATSAVGERARHSREVRGERRRHEDQQSRQAALRAQWWRPGMEALRIGLLDEAARCFEAGLAAARAAGWHDEIVLFEESLQRVRERSGGVTMLPRA